MPNAGYELCLVGDFSSLEAAQVVDKQYWERPCYLGGQLVEHFILFDALNDGLNVDTTFQQTLAEQSPKDRYSQKHSRGG